MRDVGIASLLKMRNRVLVDALKEQNLDFILGKRRFRHVWIPGFGSDRATLLSFLWHCKRHDLGGYGTIALVILSAFVVVQPGIVEQYAEGCMGV